VFGVSGYNPIYFDSFDLLRLPKTCFQGIRMVVVEVSKVSASQNTRCISLSIWIHGMGMLLNIQL
jgi:hypothetical protein